jgi:hypothetical protein
VTLGLIFKIARSLDGQDQFQKAPSGPAMFSPNPATRAARAGYGSRRPYIGCGGAGVGANGSRAQDSKTVPSEMVACGCYMIATSK